MTRFRSLNLTVAMLLAGAVLMSASAGAQEPTLLWVDVHDGGGNQIDEGVAVLTDAAGHPIVGGYRTTPGGRAEIFVRKLAHPDGAELWSYALGNPDGQDLILADMVMDHRGDLLVAGYLSDCDG